MTRATFPRRLARSYPALPIAVGDARAALKAWLTALAVGDLRRGDIVLALSEACSNVVMHAYRGTADGRFRVFAESDGESVMLTVADDGRGMVERPHGPSLGLGLPLIDALADALHLRPGPDGRGTEVSMRFAVQTTTPAGRTA